MLKFMELWTLEICNEKAGCRCAQMFVRLVVHVQRAQLLNRVASNHLMAPKPGAKAKNKGKGRGKGKAPQEPAAAIQGEDAGQQQPVAAGGEGEPVASHPANVEYLAKLQNAWSTVTSHPVFDSVQTRDPYEIEAGPILDDIC